MNDVKKLENVYSLKRDDGSVCIYRAIGNSQFVLHDSLDVRSMMDENAAIIIGLRLELAALRERVAERRAGE